MAMEPWNPWRDMMNMREAMERMLQDTFARSGGGIFGRGTIPLDIRETDSGYEVEAALPGVRPEDIQVTAQGDTLTIRGNMQEDTERGDQNQNWITHERRTGSFYRTVTLPAAVDADHAQASFEHGVLRLTLPRAEEARPRQIRIGAGQAQAQTQTPAVGGGRTDTRTGQTGLSGSGPADREGVTGASPRDDTGVAGTGPGDREGVAGAGPSDREGLYGAGATDREGLAGPAAGDTGMSGDAAASRQPS